MTQARIIATNETIKSIVYSEIDRLGNKADLNHIDVSQVTDMHSLFTTWNYQTLDFNGDISRWDVSKVENMHQMFLRAKFNGDISQWDVSKVKNMHQMFYDSKFNGDISKWDVSNIHDMYSMFSQSRFNQDISRWNVSNVKNMSSMFANSKFDGDVSEWNPPDDCNASSMFNGCRVVERPDALGKLHFMYAAMNSGTRMNPAVDKTILHWISFVESTMDIHSVESKEGEKRSNIGVQAWEAYRQSLLSPDTIDLPTLE